MKSCFVTSLGLPGLHGSSIAFSANISKSSFLPPTSDTVCVLPTFSDYGTGILDENGRCYIPIDPIFFEVVNKNYQPTIFLTKLGGGDAWVNKEEIFQDGFWVTGTPGLNFSWESRYKQINCTDERIPEEQISMALPIKQDMQSEAMVEIERSSIDYDSWSNDYLTEFNFSSIDYGEYGFNYFANFERSIAA